MCTAAHILSIHFSRTCEAMNSLFNWFKWINKYSQQPLQREYDLLGSIFCLSIYQECVKRRILNTHKKKHTFFLSIYKKWIYFLLITAVLFYEIPSSGMWAFMERFGVEYINLKVSEVGSVISTAIILSLLGPMFIGIFGKEILHYQCSNGKLEYSYVHAVAVQ